MSELMSYDQESVLTFNSECSNIQLPLYLNLLQRKGGEQTMIDKTGYIAVIIQGKTAMLTVPTNVV